MGYRPFDVDAFCNALPESVRKIAVLDRTKEPGAIGEPLYQEVVVALAEARFRGGVSPKLDAIIVGGRYGLASKEFTPPMVAAIFDELQKLRPKRSFTVGINDDVTHRSLAARSEFSLKQAPSDYPDFCRFLVLEGIDSISLTPDAVLRTTVAVLEFERERDGLA